jgi:geranyl-CoA carboxylase beta subunit
MRPIESALDVAGAGFAARRAALLGKLAALRALEGEAAALSARGTAGWAARGKLAPRERLARLLDAERPFLPLMSLAGYGTEEDAVPGGAQLAGIGFVAGTRVMVVATDAGIAGGALSEMGNRKLLRCQEIALENRLPFVHLVESAGANLLKYRVDKFVNGGAIFRNLARLSAAGIPVITSVHGPSAAGGAYMPGLSDHVVMVEGHARAYLAGPALLRAATGEVAEDEALGGAAMHARVSGLCEHLAADDAEAVALLREIVASLDWRAGEAPPPVPARPPRHDPQELAGVMPADFREPVDMREVIARLVDDSAFLPFKPDHGSATVCGRARIEGHAIGILTNNGPLDPAGSAKATHFVQAAAQTGTPLLWLQNTTGFLVGQASEEAGMVKHGAKLIQALSNAAAPQITVLCGASFGAGNYGMCGRAFGPRFLLSWPLSRTAVMGAAQAAGTMEIVARAAAARRGVEPDEAKLAAQREAITVNFERQSDAFVTSGLLLDDGVVDPRETRRLLVFLLATIREGAARALNPVQFGVARP